MKNNPMTKTGRVIMKKTLVIGLLVIMAIIAGSQIATACSMDEALVFWPSDGAENIPLNAQPIVNIQSSETVARLIETNTGAEVPITLTPYFTSSDSRRMGTVAPLKPNTAYTISLSGYTTETSTFTTGTTVDNEAPNIAPEDLEVTIDWAGDDEEVELFLSGMCGSGEYLREDMLDMIDDNELDQYSLPAHYNIRIRTGSDYSNLIITTVQEQRDDGIEQDLGTSTYGISPDRVLASDVINTIVYTLTIEDILGNTMENEIVVTIDLNQDDSSYTVAIGDAVTGGGSGGGGEGEGTGSSGCQLSQHEGATTSDVLPIGIMATLLLAIGLVKKSTRRISHFNCNY